LVVEGEALVLLAAEEEAVREVILKVGLISLTR